MPECVVGVSMPLPAMCGKSLCPPFGPHVRGTCMWRGPPGSAPRRAEAAIRADFDPSPQNTGRVLHPDVLTIVDRE